MKAGKLLTRQEEVELFQLVKAGDRTAFDRLVLMNLGLVGSVATRYSRGPICCLGFDDLYQYGVFGLIEAVKRFDESRGFKFSTYAVHWIKQAILRAINNFGFTVRVPISVAEKLGRVKSVIDRSFEEMDVCGGDFTVASAAAGLSLDRAESAIFARRTVSSLNVPVFSGDGGKWRGELADFTDELLVFDDPMEEVIRKEEVGRYLGCLSLTERRVISWRFGLFDGEEKTLEQIGLMLGVSKERVRQIEKRAIERMKEEVAKEVE